MSNLKAYKYRLYPNKQQTEKLQWTLDRARELYNAALQERRDAYRMCRVSISYNQQAANCQRSKNSGRSTTTSTPRYSKMSYGGSKKPMTTFSGALKRGKNQDTRVFKAMDA